MTTDAAILLDRLIREKPTRENRSLELLKDPSETHDKSWFMCVPSAFNDALDIKQTERTEGGKKVTRWTQGSLFCFKPGDVLYDTPLAYGTWSEALKHINICIQVKDAAGVGLSENAKSRSAGSVSFTLFKPDKRRTELLACGDHVLTQDEFVRFLIAGPGETNPD